VPLNNPSAPDNHINFPRDEIMITVLSAPRLSAALPGRGPQGTAVGQFSAAFRTKYRVIPAILAGKRGYL
jgi:hypothetical protein